MEVKARKVKEFVDEGNKVKVVLRLKRREAERMEASKRSLYDFILMVADYAVPESMPKDEGNRSIVILKRK
jgi:translation initiation factor IF-3